jgi:hypothetical protein
MKYFYFLLIIILLISCKKDANIPNINNNTTKDGSADEIIKSLIPVDVVDNFIEDGLNISHENYTNDYLQNKYGIPKKINIKKITNRYDKNIIDNIYELTYDKLYIKLYERTSDNGFMLLKMKNYDENIIMKNDIKINDKKEKIIQIFGDNISIKGDEGSIGSQGGNVKFYFNENKLIKVSWDLYY